MRIILSAIAVLFIATQGSASVISSNLGRSAEDSVVKRTSNTVCASPNSATAFLRASSLTSVDHFYTANAQEMENAIAQGLYVSEGVAGNIFLTQQDGTVPLFRLFSVSETDHFYTTSTAERDQAIASETYVFEGTAGFIYPQQICGAQPFFRLLSVQGSDHFYTLSAPERDNAINNLGYVFEGIAGYIFPF